MMERSLRSLVWRAGARVVVGLLWGKSSNLSNLPLEPKRITSKSNMKLFGIILFLATTCNLSAAFSGLKPPTLFASTGSLSRRRNLLQSAESASGESSEESVPQQNPEGGNQQRVPNPQQQQQRRCLDPLIASLTKMDEETINAPYMQVPIWGELLLDKSLFVFLPVALFAIGGVGLSLFVLVNSGDTFVEALAENAVLQSTPPPPVDVDSCRGICSSQEESLQSLSVFMKSLAGK